MKLPMNTVTKKHIRPRCQGCGAGVARSRTILVEIGFLRTPGVGFFYPLC